MPCRRRGSGRVFPEGAPLRRRLLPLDSNSFVHAVALATILGLSAVLLIPLAVLAEAPGIQLLGKYQRDLGAGIGRANDEPPDALAKVYLLAWMVPLCFLAVGCPLHRTFLATARRLGWWSLR